MAKINETPEWVPEIYKLTTEADVLGLNPIDNSDGPSNVQAEQLANRTRFLKDMVESVSDYREFTFYITPSDPDGTLAGLGNTLSGQIFRVAQGIGQGFIYYRNDNGIAMEISSLAGEAALAALNDTTISALNGFYRYNGQFNITVLIADSDNRPVLWIDHNDKKLMFRGEATQNELTETTFSKIQNPILQPKFDGMYRYDGSLNITAIIADTDDRLILWIDHNTKKLMFRGLPVGESGQFITPALTLEAIGDSQTNGVPNVTPWRTQIVGKISNRVINNWAIGGQDSGMIASRLTVHNPLLTLSGNAIPSDTSDVSVTASKIWSQNGQLVDVKPLTSQGYQQMMGSLAGVPGIIKRITDGSYTFSRSVAGGVVKCWPNTPFISTSASPGIIKNIFFHLLVIGIGRNDVNGLTQGNFSERLENLKYRYDQFIQRIETAEKRFLILSPMTGEGEPYGSLASNFIVNVENWLQDKYGDRVLNQRTYSFQFGDGSSIDNAFISDGIPPVSLRVDALHFNTIYHEKIAEWIANQINVRGW